MSVAEQSQEFCIFFIIGLFIGFLFDIFRATRKTFNISDIIVYIQDIVFLFICGLLIFRSVIVFNDGILRFYIFISLFFGILIYSLTLSNTCVIIVTVIFKTLRKLFVLVLKILEIPYEFVKKILILIKKSKLFRIKKCSINRISNTKNN